ncbi:hypothetical protein [Pseudomonas nitroreducens]|uniref:hypothetical protein n=1 Tax=Pseudomonas nitroreducens TaxID=46680 RepID=UPI00265A10EB|nr:hypothetical protein [Pseudomonas nitroreducens]MCP1652709.1 hypothetical protein [Pseudomonas nitroreducens]
MPNTKLVPASQAPAVVALDTIRQQALYRQIRKGVSMAAGLEALAERALSEGEATTEDLQNIADLAAFLGQSLTQTSLAVAELQAIDRV